MTAIFEPDPGISAALLATLTGDSHHAQSADRLLAWLDRRDEHAVVIGPSVPVAHAIVLADDLRHDHPAVSVILVRESIDTEVLTQALHHGVRDVVSSGDTVALTAAVGRAHELWRALRGGDTSRQGRVVTVFSPKGGVGKTTVSVNLATHLASTGRSVCLVDLDLAFGDVAITMQLFPNLTIEHAVGAEDALDQALIDSLLTEHATGVQVLSAPGTPDALGRITPMLVQRLLATLRNQFDFVIVDSAPNFDDQTLTALDETDECLLVATLDVPTLKNVKVAIDTLDALMIAEGHRHLVLNRADDAVGISTEKVEAILAMPVAAAMPSSTDVAAATNAGEPLIVASPDHPFSRSMRALAARLTGDELAEAGAGAGARRRLRFRR